MQVIRNSISTNKAKTITKNTCKKFSGGITKEASKQRHTKKYFLNFLACMCNVIILSNKYECNNLVKKIDVILDKK